MNTSYIFFKEIINYIGIKELAEKLNVHEGTVKRWNRLNSVPNKYVIDLEKIVKNIEKNNKEIDFVKIKKENVLSFDDQKKYDQFYTTKKLATRCFDILKKKMIDLQLKFEDYIFIEPSAGAGNIFDLLPFGRRIGIELNQNLRREYVVADFLDFKPKNEKNKYVVFGNPPFGLRGNMALRFINHCYEFADVVAFILPPLFDSDGKGTPKNRVKGYKLFYSEKLPLAAFEYPDGREINLSVCFQIWTKVNTQLIKFEEFKTVNKYLKIYSLSNGKKSENQRNVKMIGKCDYYLPSTCFGDVKIYKSFSDVPYSRGYGLKIIDKNIEIENILKKANWNNIALISCNASKNLRKSLIEKVLIDEGIFD